jgi:hypothetical protein
MAAGKIVVMQYRFYRLEIFADVEGFCIENINGGIISVAFTIGDA